MTSNIEYFNVGTIVNTHGVKGEVRVVSTTDFPEKRFKVGNELSVKYKNGNRQRLTITSSRAHKQFQLLTFEGINDKDEADKLRDGVLEVTADERDDLSDGDFYYNDIIGLKVVTTDGVELGFVKEILAPGANDVWVVKRTEPKKKDVLLPYIDEVVKQVDLNSQTVTVTLMEGLLDE
ncbi:ribosome maturation factor RimM [Geomicrobium sediminis]|uniref:Ribosome maturation factor RimM n=1 Tax=Geomicrobium sediminis TaxID=1347788 RepID=A0ABS2PBQ7_9BACL|nr:ribosome maturation factor RimM [Geomicrobium sediminis]MBM7632566.1 16S rRNA processing protein RimM [Geomicrobium sediminis]